MPPVDDRPTRWVGRIIDGRYRIVELLGEGGMGAVFVAEHLKLHKHVALKTIRAQFAANSQAEARFTREALATARLDHPHVVSAIDYGQLPEGGAYLVIQLVRGRSLTKQIEEGSLGWLAACRLGAQIADALAAAHGLGIIHRDLKPDNILLEPRDDGSFHARVLDFGIARIAADETHTTGTLAGIGKPITRMGAVVGTPGYMAPEQAVGQPVDVRADLYSLGVILWEACTGRYLWDAEAVTDLFAAQLSRPAPSLRNLRSDIPPMLSALVEQLLDRKPERRPANATVVRDELRKLALSAEVDSVLAGSAPRIAAAPISAPPAPHPASAPRSALPFSVARTPHPASTPPVSHPAPASEPPARVPAHAPATAKPAAAMASPAAAKPTGTVVAVVKPAAAAPAASSSGPAASASLPVPAPSTAPHPAVSASASLPVPAPSTAPHPAVSASASLPVPAGPAASTASHRAVPGNVTTASHAVTRPEHARSAAAIPRAVWLSGLVILALFLIAAAVASSMAVPKDISGPDDPAAAPAPADGRQAAETSTPRGRGPIEDQIAEVPAAYAAHARVLLTSDDARARERAGTAIALAPEEDKPAIPLYLRNLAWFEQVTDCEDKRPILAKLREQGDARALPGLQRIASAPPGACKMGDFRFECIECLRDELDRLIARFEAERR
ncbi:serine/threonine-protein kinase [Nannocystis radixulma]|uniref:non-specific serine/threonine protein kinase n=1 Tax=Nannocystis radixulma TaxID=2995305 RepID=A0ABT5BAV8_9BACT|nr:serine/threonine-protein kinase [Nannocystis radixulma]MDC0670649.1 protein kinase [Nannocystis radixulma]